MSRIEEIEQAIEQLAPSDFRKLAQWVMDRDWDEWDRQIDADSASGKLDKLFAEADGPTMPWPDTQ